MSEVLSQQEQQLRERLVAKAKALCARADIGRHMKIRLDDNSVQHGELVSVEPGNIYYVGRSVGLSFKVTMKCGTAGVVRSFFIRNCPVI